MALRGVREASLLWLLLANFWFGSLCAQLICITNIHIWTHAANVAMNQVLFWHVELHLAKWLYVQLLRLIESKCLQHMTLTATWISCFWISCLEYPVKLPDTEYILTASRGGFGHIPSVFHGVTAVFPSHVFPKPHLNPWRIWKHRCFDDP